MVRMWERSVPHHRSSDPALLLTHPIANKWLWSWQYDTRGILWWLSPPWDALKAYMRRQYISTVAAVKLYQSSTTQHLWSRVEDHTRLYASYPTYKDFDLPMSTRRELHLHLAEVTKLDLSKKQTNLIWTRDKNGRKKTTTYYCM